MKKEWDFLSKEAKSRSGIPFWKSDGICVYLRLKIPVLSLL